MDASGRGRSRRKTVGKSRVHSRQKNEKSEEKEKSVENYMDTRTVAFLLSLGIISGSILREYEMVPDSFFANKHNSLIQKYVKWSWGWTLCFMTPFLLLLSWARHPGQFLPALRGILRLVALTGAWYFWVEIVMKNVHARTEKCVKFKEHTDDVDETVPHVVPADPGESSVFYDRASGYIRETCTFYLPMDVVEEDFQGCHLVGGLWWTNYKYDISASSGQVFLLMLIILITREELATFWQLYESSGVQFTFPSRASEEEKKRIPVFSMLLEILLYLFAIIISLMQSLSEAMVIATSSYFHVISHKIFGTALAIVTWYVTYRLWFKSKRLFGLPLF